MSSLSDSNRHPSRLASGSNSEQDIAAIIGSFPSDESTDVFLDFASKDGLPYGITTMKSASSIISHENLPPTKVPSL